MTAKNQWYNFSWNTNRLETQKEQLKSGGREEPMSQLKAVRQELPITSRWVSFSLLWKHELFPLGRCFSGTLLAIPSSALNEATLELYLQLWLNLGLFNVILDVSSWQFWLSSLSVCSLPLFLPVSWESSRAFCSLGIFYKQRMCKHIHDRCERQGFSEGGREEKIRTHFQLAIGTGTFRLPGVHVWVTLSQITWPGIWRYIPPWRSPS